jgi:serine/threonine protein kinase
MRYVLGLGKCSHPKIQIMVKETNKEKGLLERYLRRAPGPNERKLFARKVMRVNKSNVEDVENEKKVLDSLLSKGRNDNIIEVLNHGWLETLGKVYFIDMELAEYSLADYIDYVFHDKAIPPHLSPGEQSVLNLARKRDARLLNHLSSTWSIGSQIANGLAFMHEAGHVHRDLKPQNGTYLALLRS